MLLASGLLISAAASATFLTENGGPWASKVILWASGALGFGGAMAAFRLSERESDMGRILPWFSDLHRILVGLEYPLTAEALRPIGEAIAGLFSLDRGWVLLARVPGLLVRGEVMRQRFLQVVSKPVGGEIDLSGMQSLLRDRLEAREIQDDSFGRSAVLSTGEAILLCATGGSGDAQASLGLAIALPKKPDGREKWLAAAAETALNMTTDRLEMMLNDVVRWRGRISGGGARDPLLLVRALVHELSGELSGSLIHLERAMTREAGDRSPTMQRVRRGLTRSGYWVDLLRDVPLFRDDFLAIDRQSVSLRGALVDVIDDVRPAWPDCTFHLRMDGDLNVLADRHLRSIMRNLLYNAASYSPIGGTVDIAVHTAGELGHVLVIDQGPGVPGGQLARIFDPFHSSGEGGNRAETRSGQGAGIGLSVARLIARAYGGDLCCRPKPPAEGGCFEVILPLAEVTEEREVLDHA
jgi:signal transduction histidine kinase